MLLDSGAAVSLSVTEQVNLEVCIGQKFRSVHTFIVVRDLTFECILGADFLLANRAVLDFRDSTLHLGSNLIQTFVRKGINNISEGEDNIYVHAMEDTDIPGRSVKLITASLQEESCVVTKLRERLIEPLTSKLPKHLCVARSLGAVTDTGAVVVQVMNVSPSPVKVFKGMTLAEFILQDNLVYHDRGMMTSVSAIDSRQGGVDYPDLSALQEDQKQELRHLLESYRDLFVGGLGRTAAVKHCIVTSGGPIRQQMQQQAESLKAVVNQEVKDMLSKGVIRPSSSPWSSSVVMVRKKDGSW